MYKKFALGWVVSTVGVVAVLGLVYTFGPFGQGAPPGGARIDFQEIRRDLGSVPQWQNQTVTYTFVNQGTSELRIQPEVFCSDPKARFTVSGTSFPPGQGGSISISCDPGDLEGKHEIFGVVRTNDEQLPTVTLTLLMELESKFWVEPPSVSLGAVSPGEQLEGRTVKIRWRRDRFVEIGNISCDRSEVTWTREEFEDEHSRGVDLNLIFEPFVAESDADFQETFRAILHVDTTYEAKRKLVIPVTATLQRPVTLSPRVLKLGAVSVGEKLADTLEVKAWGPDPIEVLGVESTSPFITTRLEVVEEGRHYRVHLDIQPTVAIGQVEAAIRIKTNAPFCEELGCRVVGVVNP